MNKRSILITLLISIAAGMLGAHIAVDRALRAFPGPLAGAFSGAVTMARGTPGLTDAQKAELAGVESRHAGQLVRLRRNVASATLTLAAALRGSPRDHAAIDASRAQQAAAGALQDEGVSYLQEVRQVLTAPQRAILDAKIRKLLLNSARTT